MNVDTPTRTGPPPTRGSSTARTGVLRRTAMLALCTAVGPASVRGQDPAADSVDALAELLRSNRHALGLEAGRLTGPGAELLVAEGREAWAFLVGEEHGIAEAPALMAALFRELRPAGYRHLVIETSPLLARMLEDRARDGAGAIDAWVRNELLHPLEVPFYSWREEAALLEAAVPAAPRTRAGVLWGVDQEFMVTAPTTLRWLLHRAPTDAARGITAGYLEQAEAGIRNGLARGDRSRLFLYRADTTDYERLRRAFARDARARRVIDELQATDEICTLFSNRQIYRSNYIREQLIKENLTRHIRAAEARDGETGRIMVKMGANHLTRGQKLTTDDWATGNFLFETATYRGTSSFHVMVMSGPDTQVATATPGGFGTADGRTGRTPWLTPVVEQLLDGWTLFDLRPLRPALSAGELDVPETLERVIFGYDAIVVLRGSTPATF